MSTFTRETQNKEKLCLLDNYNSLAVRETTVVTVVLNVVRVRDSVDAVNTLIDNGFRC